MKYNHLLLAFCVMLLLLSCEKAPTTAAQNPEPIPTLIFPSTTEFELKVEGYTSYNLLGHHILLENEAITNNIDESNRGLEKISIALSQLNSFGLNPTIIQQLKEVPIFVDWNTQPNGAAVYHPSDIWLRDNGYNTKKAKAVEVSNLVNFNNWTTTNQPYMVLHELTHAYHDRVLGFSNSMISEAYQNALDKNLYKNVPYNSGSSIFQSDAYSLTNNIEYFAELSEAYFGINDFFPFIKNELADYDSVGYAMVEIAWGLRNE